ncbi:MAG: glycosyltransferase, partial [Verrucomicrobiales bacterium]|nr:glycosyltransferase [Verrucomicrobiales bacterium]
RWMGPARVKRAIELLIEAGKSADPTALFSYANYPTTEYLLPANQDFVSFNVYLETADAFGHYLARLQNLAGNKPLLIAEFGVDSKGHGEEKQAEILSWHLDEACAAGLAGTTIFAWTDNWKRGGEAVTGWDFGLVRRDGSAKPALKTVSDQWGDFDSAADGVELQNPPMISVIVCTYRGSARIGECLESLENLRYPDFEVLVVNDGADEAVAEIVKRFPAVRLIEIEHGGLSHARNVGAEKARGSVFAYTDDDCVVDRHWLWWIAFAFQQNPEFSCVGGPNIPPPPKNFEQACVEVSPGGPAHVLMTDRIAEHVPGCNLAVRREAFIEIGGFNPIFRTAGDDVDFCWRLMDSGFVIGFHPAAWVWHFRRFSIGAYLRQQSGYGKAEAMLIPLHPNRFGDIGGARWHGAIYEPARHRGPDSFSRIYQGIFGYEPFQVVYGGRGDSIFEYIAGTIQWLLVACVLVGLGYFSWIPAVAGILMLLVSAGRAVRIGFGAPADREFSGFPARVCLSFLAWAQPLVRSFRRFAGSLKHTRLPTRFPEAIGPLFLPEFRWLTRWRHFRFWSEEGKTRDEFLAEILHGESRDDLLVRPGTGWEDWDVDLPVSLFWTLHLRTVTEYHEGENRLTRARLESRPTLLTVAWRIAALILVFVFGRSGELLNPVGIGSMIAVIFPEIFLVRAFIVGKSCLLRAAERCRLKRAK